MNSRSVAIFAVIVAVIVGVTYWFLGSDVAPHYTPPAVTETKKADAADAGIDIASTTGTEPKQEPKRIVPVPAEVEPVKPAAPIVMTEDDRKIDDALKLYPGNTDQDHANTAQALITLLPGLTKDGQVEAAQHISNLLADEDWGKLNHIWRNPSFNPDVIEVFATDLMNRDDKVKLPAMLEAIRLPNHPFNEEAKTTMQVFLDEDYGDDVAKWEKAMKAYLKKQEDEEKEANAGVAPGAK